MSRLEDNRIIKTTVSRINRLDDEKYTYTLADVFMHRIDEDGIALTLVDDDEPLKYECSHGKKWYALFTDEAEVARGNNGVMTKIISIKELLQIAKDDNDVHGVVINPYGENRDVLKGTIDMIFAIYKKEFSHEV
ncbi:MAG: SseB family protein [Clostridia bacterium]|nr:SseB family protein [Clostridia bacterium]